MTFQNILSSDVMNNGSDYQSTKQTIIYYQKPAAFLSLVGIKQEASVNWFMKRYLSRFISGPDSCKTSPSSGNVDIEVNSDEQNPQNVMANYIGMPLAKKQKYQVKKRLANSKFRQTFRKFLRFKKREWKDIESQLLLIKILVVLIVVIYFIMPLGIIMFQNYKKDHIQEFIDPDLQGKNENQNEIIQE